MNDALIAALPIFFIPWVIADLAVTKAVLPPSVTTNIIASAIP